MGFLGTLDPLATGLLVFALGEATKTLSYLEGLDKVYEAGVRFGGVSNTYDAEGEITEQEVSTRPVRADIQKLLEEDFLGERMQQPPVFSAIKVGGKRSYDLARRNQPVELKPRKVHFYDLKISSYAWPHLRMTVHCSSGTYIRSLAHDLGGKLGCGGYVEELRRTKIGSWDVKDSLPLAKLNSLNVGRHVIPVEDFLKDWPGLTVSAEEYEILKNGGFLENRSGHKKGPILAFYSEKCVGVLEIHSSGKLKFERRFNTV